MQSDQFLASILFVQVAFAQISREKRDGAQVSPAFAAAFVPWASLARSLLVTGTGRKSK
jgi:hypothetical protein